MAIDSVVTDRMVSTSLIALHDVTGSSPLRHRGPTYMWGAAWCGLLLLKLLLLLLRFTRRSTQWNVMQSIGDWSERLIFDSRPAVSVHTNPTPTSLAPCHSCTFTYIMCVCVAPSGCQCCRSVSHNSHAQLSVNNESH